MFKKTALAIATAATLGLSTFAVTTPAQAGYWIDGTYVEGNHGWEHHNCHWEWRNVQVWRHGIPFMERQQVRVCFHH